MLPRRLIGIAVASMLVFATVAAGSAYAAEADGMQIKVLSNRADLVSGGDALVEIVLPSNTDPAKIRVDVAGRDLTSAFAVRSDGRFLGLVTGLAVGENVLTARGAAGAAQMTMTNHPIGGPLFAGPQVQPWICATEKNGLGPAQDAQCNTPAKFELLYMSSVTGQFAAYDPNNRPLDLAYTTTDQGNRAPYVVRRERGVMDRGIYDIAVLYDPSQPWAPWAPQRGWNGKLLVPFGGDCTPRHSQGSPESLPDGTVLNDQALSRGFAVALSSLNILGQNCNDVVSAEALTMLKEHIVERYGPIRYTIGNGCSGGSMQQHWIASNYPGLLNGIQPSCSYPDIWETMQEAEDCHLLDRAFDSSALWTVTAQRAAVEGYAAETTCRSLWDNPTGNGNYAKTWLDPDNGAGCLGGLLGANATTLDPNPAWVYDEQTNPTGERCTLQDYGVAIWGRRPAEAWGAAEQRIGRGFANRPFDNVGVQYGLQALESGEILPEQFVDLNEKVGGLDIDWNWQPQRSTADPAALEIAYRSGRVSYPKEAAKVPIVDLRGSSNLEIHTDFHSYAMRARIDQANGGHGNQIIWTSPEPLTGDDTANAQAFLLIDKWLANVEADASSDPLEVKVLRDKPADAVDACWIAGEKVTDMSRCRAAFPYFADPRIAAGGPLADNILKCQLKPLDRDDYAVDFTNAQWERLRKVFTAGVCDYRKPGVAQQPSIPWLTFSDGPGGQPLGAAPRSR
ncbi:DUF6351 family protein [Nocardioides sp. NPDC051685]|uniref:DUF6351 family protein n=1 Tax=Nocardioides sp. NPDC051685 TaxID=3364334 RepID=UPI0037A63676